MLTIYKPNTKKTFGQRSLLNVSIKVDLHFRESDAILSSSVAVS